MIEAIVACILSACLGWAARGWEVHKLEDQLLAQAWKEHDRLIDAALEDAKNER